MTPAVMAFVRSLGLSGRILDVGSYNVNGSPRGLFADYTGVDMRAGPGVDIVAMANALPFPDASFDAVLCLETLEHCDDPFGSVVEMGRVLKPGGKLAVAVPGIGFHRHNYPCDYWRITADGVRVLLSRVGEPKTHEDGDHSYGVVVKAAMPQKEGAR